jgi:hypothetical protein
VQLAGLVGLVAVPRVDDELGLAAAYKELQRFLE